MFDNNLRCQVKTKYCSFGNKMQREIRIVEIIKYSSCEEFHWTSQSLGSFARSSNCRIPNIFLTRSFENPCHKFWANPWETPLWILRLSSKFLGKFLLRLCAFFKSVNGNLSSMEWPGNLATPLNHIEMLCNLSSLMSNVAQWIQRDNCT